MSGFIKVGLFAGVLGGMGWYAFGGAKVNVATDRFSETKFLYRQYKGDVSKMGGKFDEIDQLLETEELKGFIVEKKQSPQVMGIYYDDPKSVKDSRAVYGFAINAELPFESLKKLELEEASLPSMYMYRAEYPLTSRFSFMAGAKKCHRSIKQKFMQDQVKTGAFQNIGTNSNYEVAMMEMRQEMAKTEKAMIELYFNDRIEYWMPKEGLKDDQFLLSTHPKPIVETKSRVVE